MCTEGTAGNKLELRVTGTGADVCTEGTADNKLELRVTGADVCTGGTAGADVCAGGVVTGGNLTDEALGIVGIVGNILDVGGVGNTLTDLGTGEAVSVDIEDIADNAPVLHFDS